MRPIKNVLTYVFVFLVLILVTTNVYFITNYKKAIADRDKVLAENKTLQESIKKPKIIYRKITEQGKVTVVEKELIKITTQYIKVSVPGPERVVITTVTIPTNGTPYGAKKQYEQSPKPWWEEYGVSIDPNTLPDDWELKDGILYYKEKTTIKEPSKTETNRTEGPITITDVRITTNTVILIEKGKNTKWNVMGEIDSGGTVTVGAGINIKKYHVGVNIDTDKKIGIYGIIPVGEEK